MFEEYIISDLGKAVKEKYRISNEYEYNKWRIAEYKAGKRSGKIRKLEYKPSCMRFI